MKKILVPTDFSDKADFALETACEIADRAGAEVIFLHVVETAGHSATSITGEMDFGSDEEKLFNLKLIERAKEEMAARQDDSAYKGESWTSKIQLGNAFKGIRNIINEQDVDLVVMGTSGAQGFDEMLMGSTTEKVVRYSKIPVLTIHNKQEKFDYKSIALATALQDDEKGCIDLVKQFQAIYNSKINLVRINTPSIFERDVDSREALVKFAEKHGLTNYEAFIFNDVSEEEGIVYFADHINADMIAMATHGRRGLAHILSGSIAEEVVSQAMRPVLTTVIT